MQTRYEVAKELGLSESDNSPGLLSWHVTGKGYDRLFLDFRITNEDGEFDGYAPDMPPRVYAVDHTDDGEDVWVNDSGETRERWEEHVMTHWVVEQVEDRSGLDDDRGQMGLDWFGEDGIEERACQDCGDRVPVSELEEGLCLGEGTNGCFYDEHPSELIRQARKRKERIRENRRGE